MGIKPIFRGVMIPDKVLRVSNGEEWRWRLLRRSVRSNALAGIGSDQNISRAIANGIALQRMSREARGRPKDGMAAGLLLLFFTPANLIFVVSIIATHHNKRKKPEKQLQSIFLW